MEETELNPTCSLNIWKVPFGLAREFISLARSKYGNNQSLLLEDIWKKASKYDEYIEKSIARTEDLERRVKDLEIAIKNLTVVNEESDSEDEDVPKHLGD